MPVIEDRTETFYVVKGNVTAIRGEIENFYNRRSKYVWIPIEPFLVYRGCNSYGLPETWVAENATPWHFTYDGAKSFVAGYDSSPVYNPYKVEDLQIFERVATNSLTEEDVPFKVLAANIV